MMAVEMDVLNEFYLGQVPELEVEVHAAGAARGGGVNEAG